MLPSSPTQSRMRPPQPLAEPWGAESPCMGEHLAERECSSCISQDTSAGSLGAGSSPHPGGAGGTWTRCLLPNSIAVSPPRARTKENGVDRDPLHPEHLSKRPCTMSPAQRYSPSNGLSHQPNGLPHAAPQLPQHYRLEDMAMAHHYRDAYRHPDPRELRERHRQAGEWDAARQGAWLHGPAPSLPLGMGLSLKEANGDKPEKAAVSHAAPCRQSLGLPPSEAGCSLGSSEGVEGMCQGPGDSSRAPVPRLQGQEASLLWVCTAQTLAQPASRGDQQSPGARGRGPQLAGGWGAAVADGHASLPAVHGARQEEVIDHRLTDREWAEEWKHLNNVRTAPGRDQGSGETRACCQACGRASGSLHSCTGGLSLSMPSPVARALSFGFLSWL